MHENKRTIEHDMMSASSLGAANTASMKRPEDGGEMKSLGVVAAQGGQGHQPYLRSTFCKDISHHAEQH